MDEYRDRHECDQDETTEKSRSEMDETDFTIETASEIASPGMAGPCALMISTATRPNMCHRWARQDRRTVTAARRWLSRIAPPSTSMCDPRRPDPSITRTLARQPMHWSPT